jgi:hypothetical protein
VGGGGCCGTNWPTEVVKKQWVRKVYAAVTENYLNSKYYISGQRRARKALFLAFDEAWAGVSHDKILALKNL